MKKEEIVVHVWDRIVGVYLLEAELATDSNGFLRNWNHRVHIWIKFYLSERIVSKGSRPKTWQYIVIFLISAFWHGFYPFYYITFSCAVISTFVCKDIYNCWFIFRSIPSWLRWLISFTLVQYHINYIGVLHSALTF